VLYQENQNDFLSFNGVSNVVNFVGDFKKCCDLLGAYINGLWRSHHFTHLSRLAFVFPETKWGRPASLRKFLECISDLRFTK
jgi:hypothetical protein